MNVHLFCIIILINGATLVTGYLPDCDDLEPLEICPDHDSARWREREYCEHCLGNEKYHCCKDYDSPHSNCPQDDVYCEDEIYVEGCAEEKFCDIGEEPVLSFVKNQVRVEKPEVFCVVCYNNNRYNPAKNKSSATYSECPEVKKNICTQGTHKIDCGKTSSKSSERFCRCDADNGYFPYTHPDDHPIDGCSYNIYYCETGRCEPNEMMLLNYTCVCKEGYNRPNSSAKCSSIHTKESTLFTRDSTNFTQTSSNITPTKSSVTSTDKTTSLVISIQDIYKILIGFAIPIVIVPILFVIFKTFREFKHTRSKKERNRNGSSAHDESEGIPLRQMNREERNVNQTEELMEELSDDEKRDFVKEVIQHRIVHLRDNLEHTQIIDKLFQRQVISQYDYDSMRSIASKPEQNRAILDKVMTRGVDFYKSFITELFYLKLYNCFDALQEEERLVHKSIINKRENTATVEIHESETPLLEMHQEESHSETETTI